MACALHFSRAMIVLSLGLILGCFLSDDSGAGSSMRAAEDFAYERTRMVELQIAGRGIRDPLVLEAMRRVKRHAFAPKLRAPAATERP